MKRASLFLCLLLCVMCFLPSCRRGDDKMYDFPSLRIKRYCEIADSDWKNLSFALDLASYVATDDDVTDYIHNLQETYLVGCPTEEKNTTREIKRGDTVYIYYCGYVDGVAFEGGCNMGQASPFALEIGSGQFISGFEDGLIGVIPSQTSLVKTTSGTVAANDLVYLSYTCKYYDSELGTDGSFTSSAFTCQPVLLSAVPASYGATFAQSLTGQTIGEPFSFTEIADFDGDGEQEHKVYSGTVLFTAAEQAVTVSATFPSYYPQNQALAGKTATFKVVVDSIVDFIYPELTEEFVTIKLGFTPTTADPVAEYRASVKTYLQNWKNSNLASAKESAVFTAITDALKIKRWPKKSVAFFYDMYLENLTNEYDYYKHYYAYYGETFPFDSADEYIISYCQIEGATTKEQALTAYAEKMVKEQLVIFLLADKLDIKVKRSEKDAQAQIFADMLTQNDKSGKVYTADDAYEQYGDILIECSAMYNKVIDYLLSCTTFTQSE